MYKWKVSVVRKFPSKFCIYMCLSKSIIKVKDHINRTGENPLISHQKKLNIEFIDITKIYKIEKNAVNTDCCGKKLNKKYTYPSHYLCNISILAKAMGIKKISAFLVNIP